MAGTRSISSYITCDPGALDKKPGLQQTSPTFRLSDSRPSSSQCNEQMRIVAALEEQFSRLDAAVDWLRHAQARIRALREATLDAVLAGNWDSRRLGTLLREPLRNGHSAKATTGIEGVRTLTLTAVTRGDFSERNTKITVADPERVKHLWLEAGDVLIERSNTPELVGTAAVYQGEREWAIFPDLVIRVRVSEELDPKFLHIVLKSRRARNYFKASAQGISGSMPKIDQGIVERLEVPVPPKIDQERIVAMTEHQSSLIDALATAIASAAKRNSALRQSVLERAFAGELVPHESMVTT
jgi:type I restriction enzyme, S subunit